MRKNDHSIHCIALVGVECCSTDADKPTLKTRLLTYSMKPTFTTIRGICSHLKAGQIVGEVSAAFSL